MYETYKSLLGRQKTFEKLNEHENTIKEAKLFIEEGLSFIETIID